MARKKKHKDEEIFRLENELRELKSLNRSLLRELKKRNRGVYKSNIDLTSEDIPEPPKRIVKDCPNCAKGILSELKIRHLVFESCNICEYKKKL